MRSKSPQKPCALTTVTLVEEVHFDLSYTSARELGQKALAVSLSSLLEKGSRPLYASLCVGLKQDQGDIFLSEMLAGASQFSKAFQFDLGEEKVFVSPSQLIVTVSLIGEPWGKLFSSSGARPGDVIALCGASGPSAAGLSALKRLGKSETDRYKKLIEAHLTPRPPLKVAKELALRKIVTAAVELKDGLSKDLSRLVVNSRVGAVIDERLIPVPNELKKLSEILNSDPRAWTLYGGEDYSLLVTIPKKAWKTFEKKRRSGLVAIGAITKKEAGVKLLTQKGELVPFIPRLWSTLARRAKLRWR